MNKRHAQTVAEDYFDSMLRMALLQEAMESAEELMAQAEDAPRPSAEQIERFEALYTGERRKMRRTKAAAAARKIAGRMAAAIAAVLLVSGAFAATTQAYRNRFTQLLFEFGDKDTHIELQQTDAAGNVINGAPEAKLTGMYLPTYVPKGFEIVQMIVDEAGQDVVYQSDDNYFCVCAYTRGNTYIDTENADSIETIRFNDKDCTLVEKNGLFTLAWMEEDCFIVLLCDINRSESLKIAKSVRLKK